MNYITKIYSVGELNHQVRQELEISYPNIKLQGEISQLQTSSLQHVYFTLKDENASISCVLFRTNSMQVQRKLKVRLATLIGKNVILSGKLSLYTGRGQFQFIAKSLQIHDEGTLYQQFVELKQKLEKAGYFDTKHKRKIPKLPARVGVVSSPNGAAWQDIIRTFERRNPTVTLVLYPTAVQGDLAAPQIAKAINYANQVKSESVLLVARGGGSLEDLWSFNERLVAEAIFKSKIPVVTGIGHQTDISIADLIADDWQATPTAAAEKISTPSIDEIEQNLFDVKHALTYSMQNKLTHIEQRIDLAMRSLVHPSQRLENYQVKIDHLATRITALIQSTVQMESNRLQNAKHSLTYSMQSMQTALERRIDLAKRSLVHPSQKLENYEAKVDHLAVRIIELMKRKVQTESNRVQNPHHRLLTNSPSQSIKDLQQKLSSHQTVMNILSQETLKELVSRVNSLTHRLESVNPQATLNRGYSIIRKETDLSIVRHADSVNVGESLRAQLAHGSLKLELKSKETIEH